MSLFPAKARTRRDHMWWRAAAFFVGLPVVLFFVLSSLSAASDAGRVPSELAASNRGSAVMVCSEGRIEHRSDSFFDRVFDAGTFRCTAWRMHKTSVDSASGATDWPTSPRR